MPRQEAKKQEFIAAIQVVAATLAELWWDGGSSPPTALLMPPPDKDEKLLSRQDVADKLDVSVSTVDRLAKAGEFTPVKVTGRNPKFRKSEVERYIRRRRE